MVTEISLIVIAIALLLIQTDIHQITTEMSRLISRFDDSDEQSSHDKTVPQLIDWISTGFTLVKKSKEFIKNYVK
jgi:hypothetical protein